MAWTPATPSFPAWISEPVADATWSRDPASFPDWDVETTGSLHRITEAGAHRITEDGQRIIRIIERRSFEWTRENPTIPVWITEE